MDVGMRLAPSTKGMKEATLVEVNRQLSSRGFSISREDAQTLASRRKRA